MNDRWVLRTSLRENLGEVAVQGDDDATLRVGGVKDLFVGRRRRTAFAYMDDIMSQFSQING